jgi:hypothetical protein
LQNTAELHLQLLANGNRDVIEQAPSLRARQRPRPQLGYNLIKSIRIARHALAHYPISFANCTPSSSDGGPAIERKAMRNLPRTRWHVACNVHKSMNGHSGSSTRPPFPGNSRSDGAVAERAWGIVQQIDLIGRDLTVHLATGKAVFDIPPDCPIMLRGEQIKLRMVQPRDHVEVTFRRRPQRLVAERLEVQPEMGLLAIRA